MDLHVPLDSKLEAQLREHAAASGKDVVSFIVEAVREKIENEPVPSGDPVGLSFEAWSKELDEWISLPRSPGKSLDDSRDSIYGDRGL